MLPIGIYYISILFYFLLLFYFLKIPFSQKKPNILNFPWAPCHLFTNLPPGFQKFQPKSHLDSENWNAFQMVHTRFPLQIFSVGTERREAILRIFTLSKTMHIQEVQLPCFAKKINYYKILFPATVTSVSLFIYVLYKFLKLFSLTSWSLLKDLLYKSAFKCSFINI